MAKKRGKQHPIRVGVALARTVEKTGRTYMVFNQEMKRLYQKFKYGEGEYVHSDPP